MGLMNELVRYVTNPDNAFAVFAGVILILYAIALCIRLMDIQWNRFTLEGKHIHRWRDSCWYLLDNRVCEQTCRCGKRRFRERSFLSGETDWKYGSYPYHGKSSFTDQLYAHYHQSRQTPVTKEMMDERRASLTKE